MKDHQEIVLADIYHPYATIFDNRAVDQQLSRTQLEMNLGLDNSSRLTLRFEGFNTESGHCSSINSLSRPTRDSRKLNELPESEESQATERRLAIEAHHLVILKHPTVLHQQVSTGCPGYDTALVIYLPFHVKQVEQRPDYNVGNGMQIARFDFEKASRLKRGSWDCEAGGELTDHISSVSTVSVGSIGQQNDEWVCDEGDETEEIHSA
jgi:hypothetical protein